MLSMPPNFTHVKFGVEGALGWADFKSP